MDQGTRKFTIAVAATISLLAIGSIQAAAAAAPNAAVMGGPLHVVKAQATQLAPCQRVPECTRGYSVGYQAGVRYCESPQRRSIGPSGFGQFRRGFRIGFADAKSDYC
jgi:hypothetical protein